MKKEKFKPIPNFPEYFISDQGRVWSTKTGRFLKPSRDADGRLRVTLWSGGKTRCFTLYRLVAEMFLEKEKARWNLNLIGLKDNNPDHISVDNLFWRKNSKKPPRHDIDIDRVKFLYGDVISINGPYTTKDGVEFFRLYNRETKRQFTKSAKRLIYEIQTGKILKPNKIVKKLGKDLEHVNGHMVCLKTIKRRRKSV